MQKEYERMQKEYERMQKEKEDAERTIIEMQKENAAFKKQHIQDIEAKVTSGGGSTNV